MAEEHISLNPCCKVCFSARRKVRFQTARLNICQWCITELLAADLSPNQVLKQMHHEFAQRRRELLDREVAQLERRKAPSPAFDTVAFDGALQWSLREVRRREGLFTALRRAVFGDSDRLIEATALAAARRQEIQDLHTEVSVRHGQQQKAIASELEQLRMQAKTLDGPVAQDMDSYLKMALAPTPTKSAQERLLRAHQLGIVNPDRVLVARPDDDEYEAIKRSVRQMDGYRCACCHRAGSMVELHVHHIIPLNMCGTNDPRNLVTLCHTCHNTQHPGIQVTRHQPIRRAPRQHRFIAVDVETTGFSNDDAIIEFGAALFVDGQLIEVFQSLVFSDCQLPARITQMTGITAGALIRAPPASQVFGEFCEFIGNSKLVLHNAAFDMRFINRYAQRFGHPLANPIEDTLPLARGKLPQLPNHKLATLVEHFAIPTVPTHRAKDDSIATGLLYLKLRNVNASAQKSDTAKVRSGADSPNQASGSEKPNQLEPTVRSIRSIEAATPERLTGNGSVSDAASPIPASAARNEFKPEPIDGLPVAICPNCSCRHEMDGSSWQDGDVTSLSCERCGQRFSSSISLLDFADEYVHRTQLAPLDRVPPRAHTAKVQSDADSPKQAPGSEKPNQLEPTGGLMNLRQVRNSSMKSLKQPISQERKEALMKLAKMPPGDRERLLELEAKRRGIKPKG